MIDRIVILIYLVFSGFRANRILTTKKKRFGVRDDNLGNIFEGKTVIILGNGNSLNNHLDRISENMPENSITVGISLSTLHPFNADIYYSEFPNQTRIKNNNKYYLSYSRIREEAINLKCIENNKLKLFFDHSCLSNVHEQYSGLELNNLNSTFFYHIPYKFNKNIKQLSITLKTFYFLKKFGIIKNNILLGNFSLARLMEMALSGKSKKIILIGCDFGGLPFYNSNRSVLNKINENSEIILEQQNKTIHTTNDRELNIITAEDMINVFKKVGRGLGCDVQHYLGDL